MKGDKLLEMTDKISFVSKYLLAYIVVVGTIWAFIEMFSYFKPEILRTALGDFWWVLYLGPLPFILFVAYRAYFNREPQAEWVAMINEYVDDVKIYGSVEKEPRINLSNHYALTKHDKAEAGKINHEPNDLLALVDSEPIIIHSPVVFQAKSIRFNELTVLRKYNRHSYILSSSVVLVCQKLRVIVLHHRSSDSVSYPDSLHTIGGAFDPSKDRRSLIRTAHREVDEETEASVLFESTPPMILALEKPTRFLQLVFLGANISPTQCNNLINNWEGHGIVKIHFDDLRNQLSSTLNVTDATGTCRTVGWVPSGKAHVLAWLAFGAPGAGLNPLFGKLNAKELFQDIVSRAKN